MDTNFTITTGRATYEAIKLDDDGWRVDIKARNSSVEGELVFKNAANTYVAQYIFSIDKGMI